MTFNRMIDELKKFSAFIRTTVVLFALLEVGLLVVIGVVSNDLNTDNSALNNRNWWVLVCTGIIYLLFVALRIIFVKTFPGSIADEFKSERELDGLKKDSDRQKVFGEFIVMSLHRLNSGTCALNYDPDTHLCDTGIQVGISNLIEPIIKNANFLLKTTNTEFTVGIYLDNYSSLVNCLEDERGVIILEDALQKEDLKYKDLFHDAYLDGEQLQIQIGLKYSFSNKKYYSNTYEVGVGKYTIICSPFSYACNENDTLGVLFFVSKEIKEIPVDVDTKLRIFGGVISNWIYRYNQCINERCSRKKEEHVPEPIEAKKLT